MTEVIQLPPMPEDFTLPHRGVAISVYAAAGVLAALAFAIPAWILGGPFGITFALLATCTVILNIGALRMAIQDRPRIADGTMDPAGEKCNRIGLIVAIVGLIAQVGIGVAHFFQIEM